MKHFIWFISLALFGCGPSVESGQVWENKLTRNRIKVESIEHCANSYKYWKEELPNYVVVGYYTEKDTRCAIFQAYGTPIERNAVEVTNKKGVVYIMDVERLKEGYQKI